MARTPSDEARAKMLHAAMEVAFELGLHGFTIDEVAKRSGVAKTTIYRHFADRNELLLAAVDASLADPATPNTGTLRGDLEEFLESVLPIFANMGLRGLFFETLAAAGRDPELGRHYGAMMARRSAPTKAIYDRALERGEIDPAIDYPSAFEIMEGPIIVRSILRPDHLRTMDLAPAIEAIVEQLAPPTV
jgi:AcrR family transcriptional regulator